MKTIGRTFSAELAQAGLASIPLAWGKDGALSFGAGVTDEQRSAVEAVLAAHNSASGDLADKWDAIKAERDRRKAGGFKVKVGSAYKWFHSDADSRIQHLGLKDKARDLIASGGHVADTLTILGQTVKWKTMDGSFVDLSVQVTFDIVSAAGDLDAQLFSIAETHKAAMEVSADPTAYDYTGGWPKVFGEE